MTLTFTKQLYVYGLCLTLHVEACEAEDSVKIELALPLNERQLNMTLIDLT